ncbi:hypothetical protein TNCV_2958111 [Trichonephila clavipes]|nr:hypothetical protein TNCV_2958111 [Trichonephila clavipes]
MSTAFSDSAPVPSNPRLLNFNYRYTRTIKLSPYKALFGPELKIGFQSSHISKGMLEKIATEEDLDLLLNQQDHDITSTPERRLGNLPALELINGNASTSKDLLAPELIDYNASASKDQLVPEFINYTASISYDLSMVKSTDNNTSVAYDLPAADLLTKKALNLEDLQKIKSFSLSTTEQLETVNNSTSTPASTVKTSVVLFASQWKAAVNDSKACCVVCGMESTGVYSRAICKNQMHAICGNAVGEEGYGSKILCYLCQKEENIKYISKRKCCKTPEKIS